ncbi:hypothetical protein JH06_1437 [Blastocystis sp. subtype 4]|uniref:hypothetical protein n=1 Tax=Blastocystis sp. subtype 4 TaxID=944170 RepID=UPI0007115953|nr:hypothetical protein JH06_1437 [Blastocystis sp. subtype 4]KNB44849.1 hypothetical protein JH06_1437 [Blastocystis sp. subtype 4]|eukprot:XP_014528291.1 hypothetical protein JH06_1437 [Blastocystis sp. subtype 4]
MASTVTGAHICIIDRPKDSFSEVIQRIQQRIVNIGGSFSSKWDLAINQYKLKGKATQLRSEKDSPSDITTIVKASHIPDNVLISSHLNSIIVNSAILSLYHPSLGIFTSSYSMAVVGEEYRLQDMFVRYGTIFINNRDQKCLVMDIEYLPSCDPSVFRLLSQIRSVIYPEGKQITTVYNEQIQKSNFALQPFNYAELSRLYAGVVPSFVSLFDV